MLRQGVALDALDALDAPLLASDLAHWCCHYKQHAEETQLVA